MGLVMRTPLIRIGNSRGVRIPKAIIEACGLTEEVELSVEPGRLVVTPVEHPRAGWEERFAAAKVEKDDDLADDVVNSFDDHEWTW